MRGQTRLTHQPVQLTRHMVFPVQQNARIHRQSRNHSCTCRTAVSSCQSGGLRGPGLQHQRSLQVGPPSSFQRPLEPACEHTPIRLDLQAGRSSCNKAEFITKIWSQVLINDSKVSLNTAAAVRLIIFLCASASTVNRSLCALQPDVHFTPYCCTLHTLQGIRAAMHANS